MQPDSRTQAPLALPSNAKIQRLVISKRRSKTTTHALRPIYKGLGISRSKDSLLKVARDHTASTSLSIVNPAANTTRAPTLTSILSIHIRYPKGSRAWALYISRMGRFCIIRILHLKEPVTLSWCFFYSPLPGTSSALSD